jgi:hypothetical protein
MRYLSFQFFFFSIIRLSAYLNEAEEEAALTVGSGGAFSGCCDGQLKLKLKVFTLLLHFTSFLKSVALLNIIIFQRGKRSRITARDLD